MEAQHHPQNALRLSSLSDHDLLDTAPEAAFDEVTALAAALCETPIALVSLVDSERQFFKSHHGLEACETDLSRSVCAHAILGEAPLLEIGDTTQDPRTADNPLNGEIGMRFYAGAPIYDAQGLPLGTLCVLDTRPRSLTALQRQTLTVLAAQISARMQLRHTLILQQILSRETDHRVKNSLAQIAALMRMQEKSAAGEETRQALAAARERVATMARVHAEMHRADVHGQLDLSLFLGNLAEDLRATLPDHLTLLCEGPALRVPTPVATGLAIICNEFVSNSVKHGYPEPRPGHITLRWSEDAQLPLRVELTDDGIGHQGGKPGLGSRVLMATALQIDATSEMEVLEPHGTRLTIALQQLQGQRSSTAA